MGLCKAVMFLYVVSYKNRCSLFLLSHSFFAIALSDSTPLDNGENGKHRVLGTRRRRDHCRVCSPDIPFIDADVSWFLTDTRPNSQNWEIYTALGFRLSWCIPLLNLKTLTVLIQIKLSSKMSK